jgi:hypothetical protein
LGNDIEGAVAVPENGALFSKAMAAMTQLIVELMVSTRRRGGLGGKCWPLPDWRPDVPHYR